MRKSLITIFMLITAKLVFSQEFVLDKFKGLVDKVPADKLSLEYATDCQNVYFDEETNCITKRRGYNKYNSTALTGSQWVRSLYTYKQVDGDEYIIAQSSNSLFYSTGDGSFTTIISTLSAYTLDFTTAKDNLYGANGTDPVFKWNGTLQTALSVSNSTNVPVGKYITWWYNRLWISGVSTAKSSVYFSEDSDPDNFGALNYKNINVSDGDYITGMFIWQNRLLVFKRYSTWEIVQVSAGSFLVRQLSNNIGCLYQSTIDTYADYPIWLSARGVELYDGSFNLVSEQYDKFFKDLRQLNSALGSWTQDTASDWGAGSGVNIDTTTISGSVVIKTLSEVNQNTGSASYVILGSLASETTDFRESFYTDNNVYLSSAGFRGTANYTNPANTYYARMNILDNSGVYLSTAIVFAPRSGTQSEWIYAENFSPALTLTANTTYYFKCTFLTSSTTYTARSGRWDYSYPPFGDYSKGSTYPVGILGSTIDFSFAIYGQVVYANASYSSQIKQASNWGTWGIIEISDYEPNGSTITYGVKTSTASDNFSTKSFIPVSNGQLINSAVGNYIQVISSFAVNNKDAIPRLDDFTIRWFGADSVYQPVGVVHLDRYWLAVSTDNNTLYNNIVMVYDTESNWTKFSNIYAGDWCIFRGGLYNGSSMNNGYIYLQDVANLYTDDGSAIDSFWVSGQIDFDILFNEKYYKTLWLSSKAQNTGTLNFDYRLYGSGTGSWNTLSLNQTSSFSDYVISKFNLPHSKRSYFLQLRLRNANSGEDFQVNGLGVDYDVLPKR